MAKDYANNLGRALTPSILFALMLACGPEPTPKQAAPQPAAKVEEPPPPPPAPVVTPEEIENCDVVVVGEREVERAMLSTKKGPLTELRVVNGRTLEITCPTDVEERKGAVVIAELKPAEDGIHTVDNIVSWNIDLDASSATTPRLKTMDAKAGVPSDLNEDDLAQLQDEWDDVVEWAEEEEGETDEAEVDEVDEPAKPTVKKAVEKIPVAFDAGRLEWAEIKCQSEKTGRSKKVVLAPNGKRSLEPGRYKISVRSPESSSEWQDAGTLDVEAGKTKVTVTLKESPQLHAKVVSSQ